MRKAARLSMTAGLAVIGLSLVASPATAAHHSSARAQISNSGAVFVQTDEAAGNNVVAYQRAADGSLTYLKTYSTGGLGGALTGAVVDKQASEGSIAYDAVHRNLIVANAGSNDVTVFAVQGSTLRKTQVISSGGTFPVSVTTHGRYAYVLDARDGGAVQGYTINGHKLTEKVGWNRQLGLDPTVTPEFTHTPGQIGFTPNGDQLVVTTKASSNSIAVFHVRKFGALSASPVVTTKNGSVPFGFTFDPAGHLAVTETGLGALTTYDVNANGTITQLNSVATGQAATCWVTDAGDHLYTSNAGSASLTGFSTSGGAALNLLGNTTTGGGTVDADATADGKFLYAQTGAAGNVDAFSVNTDGSLTLIGTVAVPNAAGAEGIIAL